MFKFNEAFIRNSKCCTILHNFIRYGNFSSTTAEAVSNINETSNDEEKLSKINNGKGFKLRNTVVAAAFASLQSKTAESNSEIKTPYTDNRIYNASNINELLSLSEGTGVSRQHALKVVSVLADWSTKGKVKLSEFETDPRFLKLCRILTKGMYLGRQNKFNNNQSEDLSTILNITADDEAAKLVSSITLPQMVKVMSNLAQKKRRSTMLLRSLSYNITKSMEKLDIKQSADLLYCMAVLNFPDINLLEKISADICAALNVDNFQKSAVIGSILTSVGLLRYKNTGLLDVLSGWMLKHNEICRPQDTFSLFLTLAMLNYNPSNAEELYKDIIPQLSMSETNKANLWLDIVWSLVILNCATNEHIASVLNEDFVKNIEDNSSSSMSSKLKLLNINAASKYLAKNYNGPRLSETSNINNLKITRTKEKEEIIMALVDTLRNLVQSDGKLKSNVDTSMGFYIDIECIMDNKRNLIPFNNATGSSNEIKVAIMAYQYHDMCLEKVEPTGINILASNLLQAQGYIVLSVPYSDFKPGDKLIHRVRYMEAKLKSLVQS